MNKLAYLIALAIPAMVYAANDTLPNLDVDEVKETSSSPTVHIDNVRGSITIKSWDKNQVGVQGRLDDQTEKFVFEVKGNSVKIVVDSPSHPAEWDDRWGRSRGSNLTIYMPIKANIDAEGFSTDFKISAVTGEIEIETVSGDIEITGNRSRLDLETVNGDVVIEDHEGIVFAESVSGDIDYNGFATRIELESVQGDIQVNNMGELAEGEFNSVSGDIDTKTHTDKRPHLKYNAVSGDIDVSFLSVLSAKIEIETMSGDITNDLTEDKPDRQRWMGNSLEFSVGDADGDISISTVSGNVNIK
ncbi:DUF4097 family beta strand repeat-containing protein [Halioxenophilus sp. WMMB6]|uniref:DUF4097 family beta strand repeat-containing protein n=1 Tax=Halioxenophilus sp. WMMB6 TaxID=3073815 RepID=UPI00295F51E3|nr:DUF4097 family beta strand repeat-containing protein [Halioxenophilus sp. WMMB6]